MAAKPSPYDLAAGTVGSMLVDCMHFPSQCYVEYVSLVVLIHRFARSSFVFECKSVMSFDFVSYFLSETVPCLHARS